MGSTATDYASLMSRRIRRILLVCNNYDSYSLEEDGRIEVQITREYNELNLSNPPRIVRAESTVEALSLLEAGEGFDLVLTTYNVGEVSVFDFARKVKEYNAQTAVVLLTAFSRELYRQIEEGDTSSVDFVFCWNNSTDLLIAIIKLLEDRLNADHDILEAGVQAILLVEDSVRYYSTYLPLLYKLVLQQNIVAVRETLNENQQMVRKRARPKILMATTYEDAVALYERYKGNLLGIISDIGFVLHRGDRPQDEKLDAGLDLCQLVRSDNPKMPFLLQSSQESMRAEAERLKAGFVVKKSKTLTHELSEYIGREFGFGDFVVKDPNTGEETGRASDLFGVERLLGQITDAELHHLFSNNYLSKWLLARGIFSVGRLLRPMTLSQVPDARSVVVNAIHDYRVREGLGAVARFDASVYNDAIRFARLGDGSMGGKARGLAFLNHILQKYNLYDAWEGVRVLVPRSFVVTTVYFDQFILENGLQYVINSDLSDAEILSEFVASTLPAELTEALKVFLRHIRKPLAVRSSSKLEDSYYQPFAGVYSTYMIPHTDNEDQQLRLLTKAIKSVYASVYFASSRGYITATANVISEEKMAILIQEVCGSEDDGYYFPTLSGVARSLNFYPLGYEKADEGIVKLAFGLGKAVVDGDQVLRFSPDYPQHVLQTSTPELAMRDTQKEMYALNLQPDRFKTSVDDAVNLERIPIADCKRFRNLRYVVSTYDYENQRLVDSPVPEGPKFVTFAHILKYDTFPLASILRRLLDIARDEMKCGVEIEFAADLDRSDEDAAPAEFNVLQIRPISVDSRNASVNWDEVDCSHPLLSSACALGTGWIREVSDVVYLKPGAFDTVRTREMAEEVTAVNARLRAEGRGYVLIGFGRWGSSIPSLGVPVRWGDISEAKVLVECALERFRVDPSQGTHFFQNMTSFNVGYVNVDSFARADSLDFARLDALPAVEETEFLRHVRFERPLSICVDGRENRALIKEAQ
ncbi:MAG: phosphoenolpyruvate synthase [Bacteroidales bacterium]|nr:phosphoenolpyruvate synthase [Bacteroidales bacterium]